MKNFIKNIVRQNKYIEMLAYILQNNQILNSSGDGEFGTTIEEMYNHNVNVAKLYMDNYDSDLNDKIVLEIGTGYTKATMLYMIKEYNLKKVYCYDRFNCIHENDKKIIDKYNLEIYLDRLEYFSGENCEISKYIKEKVDYIVSNAVLEHVDTLELLFENLSSVLKYDGKMYHKVDLRCHNRFKKYGELYFHAFSDGFWKMMGGNIGQPNRKLIKDYEQLFQKFALDCKLNIFEEFSNKELENSNKYLNNINTDDYKVAVAEFKLCKK